MLHAIAEVDSNEDHSQKAGGNLLSSNGSLSGEFYLSHCVRTSFKPADMS
jgi:hypothetical protein